MHDQGLGVQVVDGAGDLYKDAAALELVHVGAQLDVVEQVHARQAVRLHLDVVVDVVLEEVVHLDDVGVPQPIPLQVVQHVDLERHRAQPPVARPRVDEDAPLRHVLEHALLAGAAVPSQLDLPVRALAHVLEDDKVVDRLLLRLRGGLDGDDLLLLVRLGRPLRARQSGRGCDGGLLQLPRQRRRLHVLLLRVVRVGLQFQGCVDRRLAWRGLVQRRGRAREQR